METEKYFYVLCSEHTINYYSIKSILRNAFITFFS